MWNNKLLRFRKLPTCYIDVTNIDKRTNGRWKNGPPVYKPYGVKTWSRKVGLGAVGCGAVAVVAAPVVVAAAGFGAGGIAAGSTAAWMMSLYGGQVAAGSAVAILQSIGAAGMGATATAVVSSSGAALGAVAGYGVKKVAEKVGYKSNKTADKETNTNETADWWKLAAERRKSNDDKEEHISDTTRVSEQTADKSCDTCDIDIPDDTNVGTDDVTPIDDDGRFDDA